MVTRLDAVDVVIVGLGAGGGPAAKVLAEAGYSVVGFDKGPWLRNSEHYSGDELKFQNRSYLWPDVDLMPRTVRRDENSESRIFNFSPVPSAVGGGTTHMAGWTPRPRPSDFIMHSLHGDIDGASLADWPYRYEHLEPYLTKVEWNYGISGLDGAEVGAGFRSRRFPSGPLGPTKFGEKFYEGCRKLGVNAMPLPMSHLTERNELGRKAVNRTSFWNQYGDPTETRSTVATTYIPDALATGRFEVRADSFVREVTVGPDGKATGVIYVRPDGSEEEQRARVVILALGAIESARLMLLSKSALFPDGIANDSGLVGKNATFHEYLFAVGLFDKEVSDPLNGFTGNYQSGGSMHFYETDESRGHIGGGIIATTQIGQPINPILPGKPIWGEAAKDADRDYFLHSMKIGMILQDLPQETNRVDLDPTVTDRWGLPVARITNKPHANDTAMSRWQIDKNVEILEAAGAVRTMPVYLGEEFTGNACHQHGTARMGTDPAKSVLNEWAQAHSVENLFVLDGSGFATALGVNPTLTIMAHSWRAADYIANTYLRGRSERLVLEPVGASN
ncbi:GMC family oxidoreductase [Microbacterium aurantiacum]|uniref:GMC family oxidoreductase n=1 Tax=Microbacterium aurantiacum TaxID=162393 RepID=A0AAJ2HH55_9MICO|nr:GMC family oxidoreductase [Microbacterium aurantiacum]MDS0244309.1 GMC family oxidoreductase [Microbacterium aurantiacum]